MAQRANSAEHSIDDLTGDISCIHDLSYQDNVPMHCRVLSGLSNISGNIYTC